MLHHTTPNGTASSLLRLIYEIHLALSKQFNRRVKHLGLTRPQWEVVSGLQGRDGVTQTELADYLEMGRSPLGKIIDKLEAMELVERRPDEDDRRINRIYTTAKMDPLIAPLLDVVSEVERLALRDVGGNGEQKLLGSLKLVHDNLLAETNVCHVQPLRTRTQA